LQPGLELNGVDRGGAAHVEHVHRAGLNTRGSHRRADLLREIVHVTVTAGVDGYLLLVSHGNSLARSSRHTGTTFKP